MQPGQASTSSRVFTPKNATVLTLIIVPIIGAIMLFMFPGDTATRDGVTLAVVTGVWVVIALIALLVARASGNKRITLEGNALTLVRGSSSRVLDLSDVQRLEERRVKVGRTSYTAYFAVLKDGKAAELFTKGQYPQQAQLKDAISAAAGNPWVTA